MSKINLKKTLLLSLIVTLIASVCLFANTTFSGKADEEYDYSFFLDGASVKIVKSDYVGEGKDSGAIRFSLVMSKDYFDYDEESGYSLKAGFEDFGVLVIPSDVLDENELEYGTTKVAKFSFKNIINSTIKNVAGRNQVSFNACVYNLPSSYYLTDLVAKGYVFNGTEYTYTPEMHRSIAQVAYLADSDGFLGVSKYFDPETTDYTVNKIADDDTAYTAYSDYGTNALNLTVYTYTVDSEIDVKELRINSGIVAFTQNIAGGKTTITISGEEMSAANIRESNRVDLFVDNGVYTYNATGLLTATIDDADEFKAMLTASKTAATNGDAFTGYYKQTADIDFNGEDISSYILANSSALYLTYAFNATFDGNGHVLSNFKLPWSTYNGLFGIVGEYGVIKNLAVKYSTFKGDDGIVASRNYGLIDSVYIEGTMDSTVDRAAALLVGYNSGTVSNCFIVDIGTVAGKSNYSALVYKNASDDNKYVGTITNCYYVSANLPAVRVDTAENTSATKVDDVIALYTETNGTANALSMLTKDGPYYKWGNVEIFTDNRLLAEQNVGEIVIGKSGVVEIDELENDTITSVKVGGIEVFSSQSGASVTLDGSAEGITSSASTDIVIETETAIYSGKIVVVKEIGTNAEFISMLQAAKTVMNNDGGYTGYYRLTADLDFTSVTAANWNTYTMMTNTTGSKGWQAVFDGNGYSLSNIQLGNANYKGLFGTIGASGIVKDLSVFNISVGQMSGGLCYFNYGTIENVYVEYVYSGMAQSAGGLGALAMAAEGGSKFINCVTVDKSGATYSNAGLMIGWARNNNTVGDVTITNCYAVKNSYSATYEVINNNAISADTTGVIVSTSMEDFLADASGLDLLDTSTYEKKWGRATIHVVSTALTSKVDILAAGETVTISDLVDGETLVSATIGGTAVEVSNSGDSVTFGAFNTVGEQELVLFGEKSAYVGTVRVVTAYIANATDFNTMLANKQAADKTTGFTGYYLLTADITSGISNTNMLGGGANPKWNATFDGNGYSIGNITVGSTAGSAIFGSLDTNGVIKNLAVKNVTMSANTTGALTYNCYGTIENVYVSATVRNSQVGILAYFGQAGAKISNCITVVTDAHATVALAPGLMVYNASGAITLDNCISVTNCTSSSAANVVSNPSNATGATAVIRTGSKDTTPTIDKVYDSTDSIVIAILDKIAMLKKADSVIYWGETRLN